jgi:hypothetical protein
VKERKKMQRFMNKTGDDCIVVANFVYLGFKCEYELVVANFV